MATGLDELLPAVFKATAACDEANAPLLGVPYSLWSAALAVILLVLTFRALRRAGLRT
jgi:disulfide bond formation protein DsbB